MTNHSLLFQIPKSYLKEYKDSLQKNISEIKVCADCSGIRNFRIFSMDSRFISYFEVRDMNFAHQILLKEFNIENSRMFLCGVLPGSVQFIGSQPSFLPKVFYEKGYDLEIEHPQVVSTYMVVRKGCEEKYKEEHSHVWPSVIAGIYKVRIRNYSIFMREQELFSYFEVEDLDYAMAVLASDADNQKWQEHMAPLMDVGSGMKDGSSMYFQEIFTIK